MDFVNLLRIGLVSTSQLFSMGGNGWHIPSVGSYIGWTLANIELKDSLQGLPAQMVFILDGDDDDDDDGVAYHQQIKRCKLDDGFIHTDNLIMDEWGYL